MKKYYIIFLLVSAIYKVNSQYTTIYENSFRDWLPGQGWVMINNDTISQSMGMLTRSIFTGIPPSTEILDNMLGIAGATNWLYPPLTDLPGQCDKIMMTPPITLTDNPYVIFYSMFKGGAQFEAWVVTDPNDTTINGLSARLLPCSTDGFNSGSLSNWANTTIRLAFRLQGFNTYGFIDNLKVIDKISLATIPDSCFRAFLESVVPNGFIGDQLDYLSPVVLNTTTLSNPNGCIQSLEGLEYFPLLNSINFSNNAIGYMPPDPMWYLDTINLTNNLLTFVPDLPLCRNLFLDNNLITNIPNIFNQWVVNLDFRNNLLYTCLDCSNRFVAGDLRGTIGVNIPCIYYTMVTDYPYYQEDQGPDSCFIEYADVNGFVYYDVNNNGVFDAPDIPLKFQKIDFYQGDAPCTHEAGDYQVMADTGYINMNVTQLPPYFTCTDPLVAHLGVDEVIDHNFRIVATTQENDLGVTVFALDPVARTGSYITLDLNIHNYGTITESGVVKMYVPHDYDSIASLTFGTIINDTLVWPFTIQPFETLSNGLFYINNDTAVTNYTYFATVNSTNDINSANDTSSCQVTVNFVGSPYDPNSKTVNTPHVATGFSDYLYYKIEFENIGTGNASRVTVRDYLPHNLDFSTLEVLGALHPYTMDLGHDSVVNFTFYPITLTPKKTDSLHCDGAIWYRIKPLQPMQDGEWFGTHAGVYFDTEAVVITDTALVWAGNLKAAMTVTGTTQCGSYGNVGYTDISPGTGKSIQWLFQGVTPATSTVYDPTVHYDSSGTYLVTLIINANEYTDTLIEFVNVVTDTLPVVTINPSKIGTLCTADTVRLTAVSTPGLKYYWNTGDSLISSILVSNSDLYYEVSASDSKGCRGYAYWYNARDILSPVIIDTTSCQSATANLYLNNSFAHYRWSTGDSTRTISAKHYGIYSVKVTDTSSCSAIDTFDFEYHAKPNVVITGATTTCSNIPTTLGTTQNFATYVWTSGNTDLGSASTYTAYAAGAYNLAVTDSYGCTATAQFAHSTLPVVYPTISGTSSICKGSNTVLSAINTGFTGFLWSTGDTSQAVTVSSGQVYTVTAFQSNGCYASTNFSLTVRDKYNLSVKAVNPGPCPGQDVELTAIYNPGNLTASAAGATDKNATLGTGTATEYTNGIFSNYQRSARRQLLFLASELKTTLGGPQLITKLSFQIGTLGSATPLQNFIIKMGATSLTSYGASWAEDLDEVYYSSGFQPVLGWNTLVLSTPFYWDGTSNVAIDICSYDPATSNNTGSIALCTTTSFGAYMFDDGSTDICGAAGSGAYASWRPNIKFDFCTPLLQPVPIDPTGFTWYSVGGPTTITSPHNPNTGATADTLVKFILVMTDTMGCGDEDSIQVLGSTITNFQLTADGTALCKDGDSAHLCAPFAGNKYLWNTGDTAQCINPQQGGEYWVSVSGQGSGCNAISTHVIITKAVPPVITADGNMLSTADIGQYQWFLNNVPINGANTSTYTATGNGSYSLLLTDTNGCQNFSNAIYLVSTGYSATSLQPKFQLYPNPTTGNIHIEINQPELKQVSLKVNDLLGQQLYDLKEQGRAPHYTREIDLSSLADGAYFITLEADGQRTTFKIMKVK